MIFKSAYRYFLRKRYGNPDVHELVAPLARAKHVPRGVVTYIATARVDAAGAVVAGLAQFRQKFALAEVDEAFLIVAGAG